MKNAYIFIVACIIINFGTAKIFAADAQKTKNIPTVVVQKATISPMRQFFEGTGSVEPFRLAVLASPAEGPVINSTVREGDIVKQGDVLLRIGRRKSTEAFLSSAFEDLKKEEEEVRRVEQLVRSGAIPAEQLGNARANLKKARAQAEKLRESIDDFQIKAPWDAIVSKVLVQEGNFIAPRTPLVELYDPNSLILRFSLPEIHVGCARVGMLITFHLDAFAGKSFSGKVSRVHSELDRKTHTLMLEATPDEKIALRPGMFTRIRLLLYSKEQAINVPLNAIQTTTRGEKLLFVVKGDKVERRVVQTGILNRDVIEITKGIQAEEMVVVAGGERLKNGMTVYITDSKKQGN